MLGSAVPATASLHASTSTSSATPTSPTRSAGRLRGLSYLRNYTRDHLSTSSSAAREEARTQVRRSRSSEGLVAGAANNPPLATTTTQGSGSGAARPLGIREANWNEIRRQWEVSSRQYGNTEDTNQGGEAGWVPLEDSGSGVQPGTSTVSASTALESGHSNTSGGAGMTRSRAASAQLGPTPTSPPTAPIRTAGDSSTRRPSDTTEAMPSESPSNNATPSSAPKDTAQQPTIRFIPHIETRTSRPSLNFTAITRTLPQASSIVRVGRYSERDTHNNQQSSTPGSTSVTPVGFKSKVVSRRHCEFWYANSQWYIRDVKSSSGTFLNHVRLSSPGVESRAFAVNDGDVVQLGIDFKGGEEVIFRCVKIRVECNRGWQKGLNSFNTNAHKALLKSTGAAGGASASSNAQPSAKAKRRETADSASATSSECAICLNPVAPCQALFVAPCSHVWHYKCIRNLVHGPSWPNFLCPNCRFVADLDADVEAPDDYVDEVNEIIEDEELIGEEEQEEGRNEIPIAVEIDRDNGPSESRQRPGRTVEEAVTLLRERYPLHHIEEIPDEELAALLGRSFGSLGGSRGRSATEVDPTQTDLPFLDTNAVVMASQPVDIGDREERQQAAAEAGAELEHARSTTPTSSAQFALAAGVMNMNGSVTANASRGIERGGVVTPRNDAGPFIIDGITERVRGLEL